MIHNAARFGGAAAVVGLAFLSGSSSSQAATYTYSFNATTTVDWSTGTNWTGALPPVSAASTELRYGFANARPTNGLTYENNNDLPGAFQLNVLTFQGDQASDGTTATVNINSTGSSSGLTFVVNGSSLPTLNLYANRSSATKTINYNLNLPVALNADLIVQGNGSANFVLGGPVSGSGTISKYGNSVLVISGSNSNTSDVVVYGGGIQAVEGVGLNTASRLVLDGGVFQGDGAVTFSRAIGTGAGQVSFGGDGGGFAAKGGLLTVQLNGGTSTLTWGSSGFLASGASLRFGAVTANNVTDFQNGIDLDGGLRSIVVANGAGGDSARISSVISDSSIGQTGGISKGGAATLVLTGASSYTGATEVRAGTLQLNGATGSLNSESTLRFAGGGTFTFDNTAATGATTQTFAGLNLSSGEGTARTNRVANQNLTVAFDSYTRATGATGVLLSAGSSPSTGNSKFTLTGQAEGFIDAGLFYGVATGPTGSNFAWYDTGGFVRALNYTTDAGATTAAGGASIAGTYARTTATVTAQVSETFTTLHLANTTTSLPAFTLDTGAVVTTNAILRSGNGSNGFATTISGGAGIRAGTNQDLIIRSDQSADILRIDTPILANGSNNLVKSGAGIVYLTAASTYSGTTYVNGGSLIVFGPVSGTIVGGDIVVNGGVFQGGLSGTVGTNALASTTNVTVNNGSFRWLRGTQTINNFVQYDGSSGAIGDAALAAVTVTNTTLYGGSLTIGANNAGTWDTGKLVLAGGVANLAIPANNGGRTLSIGAGGLVIDQPDSGGQYSGLTLTNYGNHANAAANVVLNGDVTYLPSNVNTQSSMIYSTHLSNDNQKITLTGARTFDIGNGIADADLIIRPRIVSTGGGGLIKTGAGTLQLESSNTYNGATVINGGTLRINGSINSSAVTVNDTGTLGGFGSTGAVSVQAGGTVAPGASVGTLTTGVLTVSGAAKFAIDVDTANNAADRLVVNNGATVIDLGSEAVLQLQLGGGVSGPYSGSFVILDNTGTGELTGSFAGLTPDENGIATFTSSSVNYTLNYNYDFGSTGNSNDVLLTFSSVPEPASISGLVLGAAALLRRRRRM